jgi:hypothetical protein
VNAHLCGNIGHIHIIHQLRLGDKAIQHQSKVNVLNLNQLKVYLLLSLQSLVGEGRVQVSICGLRDDTGGFGEDSGSSG